MPSVLCGTCNATVLGDARFCPSCGAATPTRISRETGEVEYPTGPQLDLSAARRRLQDAIGEGYEVGDLIGKGGFAEVFAAHDLGLKREVAVKVLRSDLVTSHELLARFQREAQAIAALRHPNIIPIYSVGENDGVAFFIMPLIEGESLRTLLDREGALPIDEVTRILKETVKALKTAHDAGFVHRDMKPDNILLEGDDRRVLVTDFGIAKALDTEGTILTSAGMIVGTPQYMSPEQASGDEQDHRTDIYSLGVVAYEMVTGKLPFEGSSVQAVLMKHVTETPLPVRELRPNCPGALADLIQKCLEKQAADRWKSAGDLADAVDRSDYDVPAQAQFATAKKKLGDDRSVHGSAAAGVDDQLRGFRRLALALGALSIVVAIVELMVFGGIYASPFVLVVSAVVVGTRYGRLWTLGYEWRQIAGLEAWENADSLRSESGKSRRDTAEFGPSVVLVRQCRTDRAAIVRAYEMLPRSQRDRVPNLLPAVDGVSAQVSSLTRQMMVLDQRIEETQRAVEIRGTESGAQKQALAECRGVRAEVKTQIDASLNSVQQIRLAFEKSDSIGTEELARLVARLLKGIARSSSV